MQSAIEPFVAAYYKEPYCSNLELMVVPNWSTQELWGMKESPVNFRNCLVGTAEDCASVWRSWLKENVFTVDNDPSYYILRQTFSHLDQSYERWALFASVSTINNSVKIHENVSQEGAENTRIRFELSQADLTPIFVGTKENYSSELRLLLKNKVGLTAPLLQYQENNSTTHAAWKISNPQDCKELENFFLNKELFLLDGHHRFRGAQENFRMGLGDGKLMACICSMHSSDLLILPIHRNIVYEPWLLPKKATEDIVRLGCKIVDRISWNQQSLQKIIDKMHSSDNFFYFLPVQSAELIKVELPGHKEYSADSETTMVEKVENVFSKLSGINLLPVQEISLLLEQLAAGQVQASIFLPPVDSKTVCSIANAGKILPRKSTQFHPKPALGLLCRVWNS